MIKKLLIIGFQHLKSKECTEDSNQNVLRLLSIYRGCPKKKKEIRFLRPEFIHFFSYHLIM